MSDGPVTSAPTDGPKDAVNIIFIGHVDAGKSTTGGHLLYLTGVVDKRTMEKYEKEAKDAGKESWYLSWVLDLNQEERNKGKTTEYGRAYFESDKRKYTLLDAPGHKQYVPSMIGGASQADFGILVISARKGEFEAGFERGGQTREHIVLAKTAGIKTLIIAINKMDESTVNWSETRYKECVDKIGPFVRSAGFNPKTDVVFMPISGYTGANLKDRVDKKTCSWFNGPSLLELLDSLELPDRGLQKPLVIPISDKFKDIGTVALGKIESGIVRKGDTILIMPNKRTCEVSAILDDEDEVPEARSGENVRLRLKGVDEDEVQPGYIICSPDAQIDAVTKFKAQIKIIEYKNIICSGFSAVLHINTASEEVTINALLHSIDKKTGKKTKRPPQFLKQGDAAVVEMVLNQPLCVQTYDKHPSLARFTLRDEGKTIAIGKVTKLIE